MKEVVSFYKCSKCGNVIEIAHGNPDNLSCCGEKMKKLVANTVDASREKHLPIIEVVDNELLVKVGSVSHPMTKEHYIMWICAVQNDKVNKVIIYPEQDPVVYLPYMAGGAVYAYCNLHGLWKQEIK